MHDYVKLEDDWYNGFLLYGNNFDIISNKILNMYNRRFRDLVLNRNFLEGKIGQEIIKVFSSSMKSTKPGNLLGDSNNFNWIIYSNTSVLIDNTVSWIFDGKEYLHADGDYIME